MSLITGGAGFIGSNLAAALIQRGERVVVCDRLGHGDKWRNLAKPELEDIVPQDELFGFLSGAEGALRALVHMGALPDTTERDADALIATNFRLSKRLWTFCAEHNKRFIYASSAATYGDGTRGFDDDAPIEHLTPLGKAGYDRPSTGLEDGVRRHIRDFPATRDPYG